MTKKLKNKKENISINKMQYITKKLMEGINLKFKKDPNLNIYDRYSKKIKFCKYLLYYLLKKIK